MRLNRYIARCGVTSRRKADELITEGRVFVNNTVCKELSTEVGEGDQVAVDGRLLAIPQLKYYLFNKPTGYATTKSDPHESHTIFELLPEDPSLFAVGRLDRNTSGLIIITNDGDFAQNIIHPTKKIEKEYLIRTRFPITDDQALAITKGVELEDGAARVVSFVKKSEKEGVMVIEMGRNRIVRRIIKAVGNEVSGLTRTRIGDLKLDIPVGQLRELKREEVALYA